MDAETLKFALELAQGPFGLLIGSLVLNYIQYRDKKDKEAEYKKDLKEERMSNIENNEKWRNLMENFSDSMKTLVRAIGP